MRSTTSWAAAVLIGAQAGAHAATCATSSEEAIRSFITRAAEGSPRSAEVLEAKSLGQYRARLSQLIDARYSPMSSPFREKLFGTEWTVDRLRTLPDAEFVGRYLAGGSQLRANATVDRFSVLGTTRDPRWGDELTVRYTIGGSTQERRFTAHLKASCWFIDVPDEAWARLGQLAQVFKDSRAEPAPRQGPALLPFLAAAASTTARPGMREMKEVSGRAGTVWVSSTPILTEANIAGAQAAWECDMGNDPEDVALRLRLDEAGAQALKTWSERHQGELLAVALNGEVITAARVRGVLGDKLSLCYRGVSLAQAEDVALRLRGIKP